MQFPSCRAVTARLFPLLHVTFNKALPITFEANSVSTTHLTELIGLVWDTPAEYAVPLTVALATSDPFRNSYHGFAAAVQSAKAALRKNSGLAPLSPRSWRVLPFNIISPDTSGVSRDGRVAARVLGVARVWRTARGTEKALSIRQGIEGDRRKYASGGIARTLYKTKVPPWSCARYERDCQAPKTAIPPVIRRGPRPRVPRNLRTDRMARTGDIPSKTE